MRQQYKEAFLQLINFILRPLRLHLQAAIPADGDDDENIDKRNKATANKRTEQDYSRQRNIRQARQRIFETWALPPKQAIAELVVESDTNTLQRSE